MVVAGPRMVHAMDTTMTRCPGILFPCLVDDLAHLLLRTNVRIVRYAGPICRWHDDAAERQYIVDRYSRGFPVDQAAANFKHSRTIRAGRIMRARNIRKVRC